MSKYFNYVTAYGYQQIKNEIDHLEKKRPKKTQDVKEARELGDLSENTEYSFAKRDLARLDSQLRYFKKQLQYAKIVSPTKDDKASLGKLVKIEFLNGHEKELFQIVGKQEAEMSDLNENKISFLSPLGKTLLKHKKGDVLEVKAPDVKYLIKIVYVK